MQFIQIEKWNDFQHYKDRDPVWIKLYRNILDKYEFDCLQDDSKLLLFMLWLLAARYGNKIPYDFEFIKKKASLKDDIKPTSMQALINNGFISCYHFDSKMLPLDGLCAIPEQDQDQEKNRERKEQDQESDFDLDKNSPNPDLALGLKISELFDRNFNYSNSTEQTTFSNIARHLSTIGRNGDLITELEKAIRRCRGPNVRSPKAMFVEYCKKHFGFKKQRKLL